MQENGSNRTIGSKPATAVRGSKPETATKYSRALALYADTDLSKAEICRQCEVSLSGFSRYLYSHHRDLMLKRNGISCSPEEAASIKINQWRRQHPKTHEKYKEAIAACDSMEYIGCNVSEIAREFGLDGTNLANQLRMYRPEVLELREKTRRQLGINDNLPRGMRHWTSEQYADAVELLRSDRYISVKEAADRCDVSYKGLEQHLRFYHQELVDNRIKIRKKAVRQKRKGKITGRGTEHAPTREAVEKYAAALNLYSTTNMSARKIAMQTGVPVKGFYDYLEAWHKDEICKRRGIPCSDKGEADLSSGRRYNVGTAEKYSAAIAKLKEGGMTTAEVAAEFELHPDTFRQYLKEHEPELHASLGMKKSESGKLISPKSLEKYKDAIEAYKTTSESLKSIASRFGHDPASLGQFIRRHFPELVTRRKNLHRVPSDDPQNKLSHADRCSTDNRSR